MPIPRHVFDNDFFGGFGSLQKQFDDLFGHWPGMEGLRSSPGHFPPLNIQQQSDKVLVYLFAAGLDRGKTHLEYHGNQLTVEGERGEVLPENAKILRSERYSGSFRRVINLPEDVDGDRITAQYRNGVLLLTAPRATKQPSRQITIDQDS